MTDRFCGCVRVLFDWWHLTPVISHIDDLSLIGIWCWSSPTTTMWYLICDFSSSSICFLNVAAPVFDSDVLRILQSSWWLVPLMSIKRCFSPLLTRFHFKTLIIIRMVIPASLWLPFTWLSLFLCFYSRSCLSLLVKCVFGR